MLGEKTPTKGWERPFILGTQCSFTSTLSTASSAPPVYRPIHNTDAPDSTDFRNAEIIIVGTNVSLQTHRDKKNDLISMNQLKLFLNSWSLQGGNSLSCASWGWSSFSLELNMNSGDLCGSQQRTGVSLVLTTAAEKLTI